jgi:hypothetical protein
MRQERVRVGTSTLVKQNVNEVIGASTNSDSTRHSPDAYVSCEE